MAQNTKTEARVLRAMRLIDEDAGHGIPCLQGYKTILSAVNIMAMGRKSSERNISNALASLTEKGIIEKSTSGGHTLYIIREQS